MRLFIGVQPPLELAQECLRRCAWMHSPAWRLVRPDKFHLTLHFLGEQDPGALPAIVSALTTAADGLRPFSLVLSGHGAFPREERARIVWASVDEHSLEPLQKLHAAVRSALRSAGVTWEEKDREFQPHFTLGRTAHPGRVELPPQEFRGLSFEVSELRLYRSIEGRYETLHSVELQK